jgi:hyperosmotically inducible protein
MGLLAACVAAATTAAPADTSDAWITTKAKIALLTSEDVGGLDVDVDTVDGKVTLHGKVASAAEKARAEEVTRRIDGVKEVTNLLQVVPSSRRESAEASDEQIEQSLSRALDADPALAEVEVASVNAGVVLLEGDVADTSVELEAVETARAIPGVRRVSSEIRVEEERGVGTPDAAEERAERAAEKTAARAERAAERAGERAERAAEGDRPDSWVTLKTKLALLTSEDVSGLDIDVDTANGRVTLKGKVETPREKSKAEAVARSVEGVRDVENRLQVVPASRREAVDATDDQIEDDVQAALEADGSLKGISVGSVESGVVVLEGDADSLQAALRAVEAARRVRGVRRVASEIAVEGEPRP